MNKQHEKAVVRAKELFTSGFTEDEVFDDCMESAYFFIERGYDNRGVQIQSEDAYLGASRKNAYRVVQEAQDA